MKKIVYLALDERPCNYKFSSEIFQSDDFFVVSPKMDIMPYKRKPANYLKLKDFLITETKNAYGLVISMDTLLYGGLVPSRIHDLSKEVINERLDLIKYLKQQNEKLIIFGFQTIMRCPQGTSGDEEPIYFKKYGKEIFLNGHYKHKDKLGIISDQEIIEWKKLDIPNEYLKDFEIRREINLNFNLESINLAKEDYFDFLVMCQDDSGEYCYPAMDQEIIAKTIKEKELRMKVYAYAGADELGMILIARMLNHIEKKKPKFYIKYPSITTPTVIPCLEDRYLDTTVKYQIIASGGIIVPSVSEADLVLVSLMGATKMFDDVTYNHRDIDVLTNMIETFEFIKWVANKKPVIIADLFFKNAGSLEVLKLIKESNIILDLAGYAGWNTASNSLGTCIAQGIQFWHKGKTKAHIAFLIKRYIEDIGYGGIVRESVNKKLEKYNMNYFNVLETKGTASELVREELIKFIDNELKEIKDRFRIENVNLPWKRMFEVDFDIILK